MYASVCTMRESLACEKLICFRSSKIIFGEHGILYPRRNNINRCFLRGIYYNTLPRLNRSIMKNTREKFDLYKIRNDYRRLLNTARDEIRKLEETANKYPSDANAQYNYLSSVVDIDPTFVMRRIESCNYAIDGRILNLYNEIKNSSKSGMTNSFSQSLKGGSLTSFAASIVKFIIWFAILSVAFQMLFSKFDPSSILKGKIFDEIQPESVDIRFNDVKGNCESKEELLELVDFLKNPKKYRNMGCRISNGVLMVGPPGTGKTMLAKAVAGESNVPFYYATGSEFEEMYVGVGASRVRKLFDKARTTMPCIIFIDELDAIGSKRTDSPQAPYSRMTINQLLTEMDGFKSKNIVVIGATNDPDVLDPALTRSGRFDIRIEVPLPSYNDRVDILDHYIKKVSYDSDIDVSRIAALTPGASGADLSNLVNQAAVHATLRGVRKVSNQDFDYARDKLLLGRERSSLILSEDEKRRTALHEAGHTIVAFFTKGSKKIHKATIVPRGRALGVTHLLPDKDEFSSTYLQLMADIDVSMGGRAAEEVIYGHESITTGCGSDLQNATNIAKKLITVYGYSDQFGLCNNDIVKSHPISPDLDLVVHKEVKKLLEESYKRAVDLISRYSNKHKLLAEALLKYETLNEDQITEILS